MLNVVKSLTSVKFLTEKKTVMLNIKKRRVLLKVRSFAFGVASL